MLVIDDDPDVGRIVRQILELEGYEVLVAEDGLRGLACAQRQRPDAIIVDLMMPVMDGFEVLAQLQHDGRTSAVPVVVLTAMAVPAAIERAGAAGASAVLTKPFDAEELTATVAAAVTRSGDRAPR